MDAAEVPRQGADGGERARRERVDREHIHVSFDPTVWRRGLFVYMCMIVLGCYGGFTAL